MRGQQSVFSGDDLCLGRCRRDDPGQLCWKFEIIFENDFFSFDLTFTQKLLGIHAMVWDFIRFDLIPDLNCATLVGVSHIGVAISLWMASALPWWIQQSFPS